MGLHRELDLVDGPVADQMPSLEHSSDGVEHSLAKFSRVVEIEQFAKISYEMRPAKLATTLGDPVIAIVAVGDHDSLKPSTHQLDGYFARSRAADEKDDHACGR